MKNTLKTKKIKQKLMHVKTHFDWLLKTFVEGTAGYGFVCLVSHSYISAVEKGFTYRVPNVLSLAVFLPLTMKLHALLWSE